jgi:hypothetical protein
MTYFLLFAYNITCYINVLNVSYLFSLLGIEQFKSLTSFSNDADGDEVCVCPRLLSAFRV